MHVIRFRTLQELIPWAAQWNQLAQGNPFRSWQWQSGWWRHYAQDASDATRELFVLAAFDDNGLLVGLAPWYLQRSAASGNVLRFLGSGEVCAEYLGVLSQVGDETNVAGAFAGWLCDRLVPAADGETESLNRWDLLDLSSVDAGDQVVGLLTEYLTERGCSVHRRPGMPCWRLELPNSWEAYLAMLSKPVRRTFRRAEKEYIHTGRAVTHTVTDPRDLPRAFEMLIDLHQRRRTTLGDPGCFASPQFTAFHREVAEGLLARGALQLQWLEIDGQPAAVEYQLCGDQVLYAYQSGLDPLFLEHQPGTLASIATIQRAIQQRLRAVDFLRGDEPYKAQWRAQPRPIEEICVVPPTAAARLRYGVRAAGDSVKSWIKSGLELVGVSRHAEA